MDLNTIITIPNSNITVFYNQNSNHIRNTAAQALSEKLYKEKDNKVLFLVSGGSALSVLNGIDNQCISSNVTIGVLDERYSKDVDVNIFSQLMRTSFYRSAIERKCRFLDTRVQDNESFDQSIIRFARQIKLWFKNNKKGVVIVTQGMGSDGHTAGIMPYPENSRLFHKLFGSINKLTIGYDAKNKNLYSLRVVPTMRFLMGKVNVSFLYIIGKNKEKVLNQTLLKHNKVHIAPIEIIKKMKSVAIFTDIKINT